MKSFCLSCLMSFFLSRDSLCRCLPLCTYFMFLHLGQSVFRSCLISFFHKGRKREIVPSPPRSKQLLSVCLSLSLSYSLLLLFLSFKVSLLLPVFLSFSLLLLRSLLIARGARRPEDQRNRPPRRPSDQGTRAPRDQGTEQKKNKNG